MDILIVEDEPRLAESMRILLENRKLVVELAADGNAAVDALRDRSFDLVLLDMVLPGYDGHQILELAGAKYPDTPVIVLTGMASVEAAVKCMKRGAFDFLKKPFDPEELMNRVERALEHKALREHRRSWEAAYRTLVEHSIQGVVVFTWAGLRFVNRAAADMLGRRIEDLFVLPIEQVRGIVHPDDREAVFTKSRRMLNGEPDKPRAEYRILKPDGAVRWHECYFNPIIFEGAPALHATCIDITDRKTMEAEVFAAKEYADNIIQSSIDMIIVVDGERRIVEFNRAAEECFGYSRDEVMGRDVSFLYSEPQTSERVSAAVRERGAFVGEIVNARRDGSTFTSLLSAALLRDRSGAVIGVVGTSRDITEQKELEESLRRSLAEKELLLKELHHRVKNNMQLVSSFLNIQKRRVRDPEARQAFDDSRSRINTMSIIHNTLHHTGELSEINFASFAGRIVEHLRSLFADRAEILIETEIEQLSIGVDQAVAVGLVVNELVSNAFKHAFSENDEGTIRVSAERSGKRKVRLVVRDDGRPAQRSGRESQDEASLGLRIVGSLVQKQLGGKWTVDTDPGTTHTIVFKPK